VSQVSSLTPNFTVVALTRSSAIADKPRDAGL